MGNSFLGRTWHIKPRIFMMLLLLMTLVFSSVFIAFNLFINSYIQSNVQIQLDELVNNFAFHEDKPEKPPGERMIPELPRQQKNRFEARGEVIILDQTYAVKSYNELSVNEDLEDLKGIAAYLKEKDIPLDGARYVSVNLNQGVYYISSIEDMKQPGSFLVFYVNVAGIHHLVETVNLAMAVIVAAAMAVCFAIANMIAGSITKPVKQLSAFAVEIGKGNFQRREIAFQDKEFNELGEAMNQSAEKLDIYDKDQQAFFQNVSHELRTPLQSIRCYAEGVAYGLMDPKHSGTTIIAETDRLSELVEDLLYISRVDNITTHVAMQVHDLRDTLAFCAESFRSIAQQNGLQFVFQFDEQPVLLLYNEKHMYRAFSNLIANASRYARHTITLCCRNAHERAEVAVMDDGSGISAEDLPHIFERFYKGRDGKHGIGLSIVKAVIELHNGQIAASSDTNTVFSISLPKTPL